MILVKRCVSGIVTAELFGDVACGNFYPQVSSGTVLQAQKLIQQLITICNTPPEENKVS